MRFSEPGRWLIAASVFLAPTARLEALPHRAPHIFFSDLESGPNLGGENNGGAYVTIYGRGFGDLRGGSSVRIGGVSAAAYRTWNDTRIAFQLGARVASGDIVVQTASGQSNGIPFSVRGGKIYFVAAHGDDGKNGTFSSPWRTLPRAVHAIGPGDIVYAMDGVVAAADDGEGWESALVLRNTWCSSSGYPRALIAYPGASVTIGNAHGKKPASGLRTTDFSAGGGACVGNWVFGGLRFRGRSPVVLGGPSSNWRLVGNDISCPTADGSDGGSACFITSLASHVRFLGNVVHDAGAPNASALFHGVYFSSDSNHLEIAWNTVANVHGCRGLQIHSSPLGSNYPNSGFNQYDIAIHDNVIHDTQCDGIILDTIDPSKGPVRIYNNVIYRAGIGPNNPEKTGGWACIYIRASTEKGPPGSGTVEIDHNTMYSCGAFAGPPYASANAAIVTTGRVQARVRNNLIYQTPSSAHPSGVPYLVIWNPKTPKPGRVCGDTQNCPWLQGSNNLFFGAGPPPGNPGIVASVNVDPQLVNPAQNDFHLAASSPARGSAVNTGLAFDADGNSRGLSRDIGAYQYQKISQNFPPEKGTVF